MPRKNESIQLRRLKRRIGIGMPLASGPDRERERPRPCAQLTIPLVPKFPLSSPITDEIASPSESDEEERERERDQSRDHEMERNRPFDFLAKMSDKNRDRDWDCTAARRVQVVGVGQATTHTHTASTSSATTTTTSTEGREGSSRRPVGLNLDIPRSTPQTKQTTGPFIDLNDLKVLSKAREEERTAAKLKGILKKGDTKKAKGDTRGFQQLQDDAADMGESRKRASLLDVLASGSRGAKRKVTDRADGISPTDRPIVIGFSVPYDSPELMNGEDENGHEKPKEKELNSAGTQFTFTPPTPSIIVTPAKEDGEDGGFWNHLSPEDIQPRRPRAASSVYSQPSPHLGHAPFDAPPVPALPALYSTGNDSSTLASTARPGITNTVRKRRSMSASVVNEKVDYDAEDEKPAGRPRSNSIDSKKTKFSKPSERLTINTALNARASQGWWNYLLSPLLSASSLLSPKTPTTTKIRPQLPTISTSSTGLTDEWWEEKREWVEKEKDKGIERSYFSPDTPEATMRISSWQRGMNGTNPFADFDWSIDEQGQAKRESQGQNPGEQDQDRGVSMMFSGQRIQGAAAEYYQACAHELFSGTPYFECEGHVCSITLKDKIAVAGGEPSFEDTGEGNRNLLIDVDDMPRSNNLESPASGITSINSSPSDDAGRLSASLNGSRATPSERAGGSPAINSPGADAYGGARGPPTPVQTNPYLEQPREYPPPAQPAPNNIHVESVAAPPPANIHIEAPTAQPSNYHYEAPAPPAQPMALDAPDPYGASRGPAPSPNPFDNPRLYEAPRGSMASHNPLERSGTPTPDPPAQATRTAPAPITMPSPEQTPPPNYGAQAYSPYPRSPESLQSSTDRGAIRMSNVSMPAGPAPAYTPHDNAASSYYPNEPLPPRIRAAPITTDDISHPYNTRTHIEARRRRYEREDAAAHKAGGFWRGRGPFSNKGCFGRSGREGRLRRRWYAAIALFFIAIVVGAILLAVFLTRKGDGTPVQSQWLNLTGYPPIPTGISTIAGPEAQVQKSGCIQPSSLWSCALPREQQGANQPYDADRPNFRVEIRFQNGSYEHSTVPVNASGSLDKREVQLFERGTNQLFNPSPEPPSSDDQVFMGKTTDNTSEPYDGEETPFYITFLSTEHLSSSSNLHKRDSDTDNKNDTSTFPDISSLIPTPPIDSDGTAAPAILHPLPISQPLRLYNRGKDDEHYGFYSYFDKSIFLASDAPLTQGSKNKESDLIGGSTKEDARVRCTWAQTRFKVAVWTREDRIGRRLIDRETNSTKIAGNSTSTSTSTSTKSGNDTSSAWEPTSSATDFTSPGSFPYPVSISLDRHGGDVSKKMVYCYGMEEGMRINGTEKMLQVEDRGWGGEIVNQAPGIFSSGSNPNSTGDDDGEHEDEDKEEHGGYDGGSGGCGCEWVNWVEAV